MITGAVSLFCMSAVAFHFLGGEFIPSLEEGDFAVEMSMSQGTSLSQMVESCSKAEKLLKAEYPEIKQVVSRIGSAEIPTDPMPVERADIMVALKPKAEWTSAETTARTDGEDGRNPECRFLAWKLRFRNPSRCVTTSC